MKKFSKETRKKMSEAKKGSKNPMWGKTKELHPNWNGGSYTYFHQKAKELFGEDVCQKCGLKLEDKESDQVFDMHCWGDWKNLKEDNWGCVCRSCHKKIHKKINDLKF